jgi:NAD(P)-dependent dehydrogenase (short-subunit alcohol dehydrogenase family)
MRPCLKRDTSVEGGKIRLENRIILVAGFGGGLGRELAVQCAREGALIAGFSRRTDAGAQTAKLIADAGGTSLFVSVDVGDANEVDAGMAQVIERFGGLDGVVNCAGIRVTGTAVDTSPEQWDMAIATNLTGTFLVSRAAIPHLQERNRGAIVNITTTSALRATAGRVAHGVSKAAVHMLTQSMALDHAADRIRVNCVCPGPTALPLTPLDARDLERAALRMPTGRVGTPSDVGEVVTYLLSDASEHVTGVILPIDGGLHLIGSL